METTCSRCHQVLLEEACFCPACGLPQLEFTAGENNRPQEAEPWSAPVRDAATVDWKLALRIALLMALPAGILSSSPLGFASFIWMSLAAYWTVAFYLKSVRPAWITFGAGARIGLVTGLLAGWFAVAVSGGTLFVQRYFLHQGGLLDGEWHSRVLQGQQMAQQISPNLSSDAAQLQAMTQFRWMLSPEGHAGMELFRFTTSATFLVFFAVLGGAMGARIVARRSR